VLEQKIIIFEARTEKDVDGAFTEIAKSGAGALLVGSGQLLTSHRRQLIGLAALRLTVPAALIARADEVIE
jgi:hypothetical protein